MTTDLTELRWLEVQFYTLCRDIAAIRSNPMDVMDFIDSFVFLQKYRPEQVKPLAQEILSSQRCKPSKEEFALLCYRMNLSVSEIKERTGLHNRTLYELVNTDKIDPRPFYPRLTKEQLEVLDGFMECINKIRKAGV